jgi:hypothetical protein
MTELQRLTRWRMAATGENYLTARRALLADQAAFDAARAERRRAIERQRYPATDRDGLDRRHVLSAWETARRRH